MPNEAKSGAANGENTGWKSASQDIQFDRAEFDAGAAPATVAACAVCKAPISGSYFEAGGQVVCPACVQQFQNAPPGSGFGRFARAALAGFGAAIVGTLIYFAVEKITGITLGLIALVVGFLVGGAVRWGAQRRGGWLYQLLAIGLTYLSIGGSFAISSYQHMVAHPEEFAEATSPAARLVVASLIGLVAPALSFMDSPILTIIIAFALWEAWRLNRRAVIPIQGPFALSTPAPPAVPSSRPAADAESNYG